MGNSTAATRLHTICVLRLYGHNASDIADMIGIEPQSVSRILNTPKGRDMMMDMQAKQVELAIDPIQQRLAEYADEAALKLHELLEADAENVQRMAAKDILEMAGYTPKRNAQEVKEADTTIIVGQMNVGDGASAQQIKESILEHSGTRYEPVDAEVSTQDVPLLTEASDADKLSNGGQEQERDEQAQVIRLQPLEPDADGRRNGSGPSERVQQLDEADDSRLTSQPGKRWLSDQSGSSSYDG